MVRSSRFSSSVALAAVLLLAALLPVAAADAATKKHFAEAYACGSSDDSDSLGSAFDLTAYANLGHWTGAGSSKGHPCAVGTTFHPSVKGVKITFRWYAGTKLVRTSPGKAAQHAPGRYADLKGTFDAEPGSCHWTSKGKAVTAKITLAKSGYATRVIKLSCFAPTE